MCWLQHPVQVYALSKHEVFVYLRLQEVQLCQC